MRQHGIVATFDSVPAIYKAAEKVRDAGFRRWDCLVPFPIHNLHHAMGLPHSHVPKLTLLGGITGFITGNLISWYMGSLDYSLIVGGKPFYSPIFTFPVSYELTILFSAFGTLGGMFLFNLLPRHNHPVFNHEKYASFTDDKFCVVIEALDPQFNPEKTRQFLKDIGGKDITEVFDDE
jgi:hypothetical protein